jgi:hypothetical protein
MNMATSPDQHDQTHPANRPAEPEHPMMLDGSMVPGDVELMARCLFEEMLMVGTPAARLRDMSNDPEYQALYAMRVAIGNRLDEILNETLCRVGVHHHTTDESTSDVRSASLTVHASDH